MRLRSQRRIERMKSEDSSTSAFEFFESAQWAEQRESELGRAAPNCPTAAELWRVVSIVKDVYANDQMGTAQINAYMVSWRNL